MRQVAATSRCRSGTSPALASEAGPDSHKEHRNGYPFPRRRRAGPRHRRRPPRDRPRAPLRRAQLRSAARRARARRRLLAVGRARAPLSRHDERVLGGEPRPRASAHRARAGRAGAAARRHVARLPQRAAAARCCSGSPKLTGLDRALPANGGAEAVETALKAARKWGHKVKGIPADRAEIIVCAGNFHGRSITIVGFSSEPQYRDGFGPFAPGFRQVPFGDADALARAIGPNTAAFLVEPIQGEGGIIVPPAGYLARVRAHLPRAQRAARSATRSRPAWAAPENSSRASTRT